MPIRTAAVAGALAAIAVAGCASSTSGAPTAVQQPQTTSRATTPPSTPRSSVTAAPTTSAAPSSESASESTHPVPDEPLRRVTVTGASGRVYAISIWADEQSSDCAAHAYGQVADFLAAHQCTGIRQVLATTAINGKAVGFAQNSVGFAGGMDVSYQSGGDFRALVTSNGTGNLNDLLREGYRLPAGPSGVPQPDAFEAIGQDAGVVVTDAWFLDGPTAENDPRLVLMARDIFLQI